MEVTREQIELLQKHEVDEHTILEIIKDLADKQANRTSGFGTIPDHRLNARPRKKRATKAEMELRKQGVSLDAAKEAVGGRPADFQQEAVDFQVSAAKRRNPDLDIKPKGKQTSFDPPTF